MLDYYFFDRLKGIKKLQTIGSASTPVYTAGVLYGWGYNATSLLGFDTGGFLQPTPIKVDNIQLYTNMSSGYTHSLVIRNDGNLYSCGQNQYGQLGNSDGLRLTKSTLTLVTGVSTWKDTRAGGYHSLGIKTDGSLWGWGRNFAGQLGDNTQTETAVPVNILPGTTWALVRAGGNHSIGIKTDGSLWCWGQNQYGQIGNNNTTNQSTPVNILPGTTWLSVAAGNYSSYGITNAGTLYSWGMNASGMLGNNNTTTQSTPVNILPGTTWALISAGLSHAAGIKTDGTLWSWGNNAYGQLGVGDVTSYSTPTLVSASSWSVISAGGYTSAGITTTGILYTWGAGNQGQHGNGGYGAGYNYSVPSTYIAGTWSNVHIGRNGSVLAIKV